MVTCVVDGTPVSMMVDTGAAASCLTSLEGCQPPLSKRTMRTVGISGKEEEKRFTIPLETKLGKQLMQHAFLYSPRCPVNLMGRDLLTKLGAEVKCTSDGLQIQFKGGQATPLLQSGDKILMMSKPEDIQEQQTAVYWARVLPGTTVGEDINTTFQNWKPWINEQGDYRPPLDPLHNTYNFARQWDEVYDEAWEEEREGLTEPLAIGDIIVGQEGVAAHSLLTPQQLKWYTLKDDGEPHVTLAVAAGHQAKQLGPMMKRAIQVWEWYPTGCPKLHRNEDGSLWRISHKSQVLLA